MGALEHLLHAGLAAIAHQPTLLGLIWLVQLAALMALAYCWRQARIHGAASQCEAAEQRQALQRLSLTAETAGLWVVEWHANGQCFWNANRPKDLGTSNPTSLIELGQQLGGFVDEAELDGMREEFGRAIEARDATTSCRYQLRLPNAVARHQEVRARFTYDAEGRHLRTLCVVRDVTDEADMLEMMQRRAEQERVVFEHLSIATHAAGIHLFEHDFTTDKVTWEQPRPNIQGMETLDAASFSKQLFNSLLPEDQAFMRRQIRLAKTGEAHELADYRVRVRLPNARLHHLHLHGRVLVDGNGRPVRLIGVGRDATQEVEAAAELATRATTLRQMQEHLDRAALSSQEGHWERDLQTGKTWLSSSLIALLGYPASASDADIDITPVRAAGAQGVKDYLEAFSRGEVKGPYDTEFKLRTASGEYRWFHSRGQIAEYDEHGRPRLFAGSIQDVHERKLAAEALSVVQRRFQRAIEGTQDGIWDIDLSAVPPRLWLSPRGYQMLGYAPDEIELNPQRIESALHPDDVTPARETAQHQLSNQLPCDLQVRLKLSDGDYRWFHIRGRGDWDENGKALHLSGSMQDVTERSRNAMRSCRPPKRRVPPTAPRACFSPTSATRFVRR